MDETKDENFGQQNYKVSYLISPPFPTSRK